jgi:hypothetical protein
MVVGLSALRTGPLYPQEIDGNYLRNNTFACPHIPLKFCWGYRDARLHEITGGNTQVKFSGMSFRYFFKVLRCGLMFTLVFCEHRPTVTRMRVIDLNTLCGVMEQS